MTHPPFIKLPELFGAEIAHGFFGRKGGVSDGVFKSLNVTLYSGDDVEKVEENRARIVNALGGARLLTLKQIHSSCCLTPAEAGESEAFPEGDALVTDEAGVVLGVMTADCAPVLFAGKKADGSHVIGAAHAGWGGALKGVCEATVRRMVKLGAEQDTIAAAIGPCIGKDSYEVSPEFIEPFVRESETSREFFTLKENGKLLFDLETYVIHRLTRAGVRHIAATHLDTFADEENYFSFRRSTHRGEEQYGRQISAVAIST